MNPNILIIHADQHRFDCLGCMQNKEIKTPNIDSLATDGVVYENCFATFPLCTPSRYSFLTGLYVHQHLAGNNQSTLPQGLPKFPQILKDHGYHTKCVGKMHYTPTYLDVGFDEMLLSEQDGPGRYDDDYHRYLKEKNLVDKTDMQDQVFDYRRKAPPTYSETFGTEPSNLDEKDYSTTWIGDRACEELNQWKEGNNLLMVGFIKPHHPFDAPAPWSKMYNPESLSLLEGWHKLVLDVDKKYSKGFFDNSALTELKLKQILAQYYASISQIDHHVGRMISILKEKGLYENTLIIYTSDHGEYMGFHHMVLKGNYMYDPVIKVPLIVKYPSTGTFIGEETKNLRNSKLVSIIDITGTILETADAMIPPSLWKTVMPLDPTDGREYVFAENNDHYMIRSSTKKLLYSKEKESLFFNLIEDPNECQNLYNSPEWATDIQEMKEKLFDWIAFECNYSIHLDENAPINQQQNVPKRKDGHRLRMKSYFETKMKELKN